MSNNSIKNLIVTSKRFIKKKWLETKNAPKEKVQELKDFFFIPILNKLLFISLECIDHNDDINFILSLDSFKEIYGLSNQRNLGYNGPITEWIKDTRGRDVKAKDHLSCTVPSKETLKRFYILAAFITKISKYKYFKNICDLEIENENNGRYTVEKLLFYPNFNYRSGEGTLTSVFDEARELIVNKPTILNEYFDNDNEKAINSMCRGDFLIEYYYFMNYIKRLRSHGRFLNFPRFYYNRVKPLIEKMILKPSEFENLATLNKDKFLDFFRYITNFSKKNLAEYLSNWYLDFVLDDIKKMLHSITK